MKRLLIIFPILSLILAGCYREPVANATILPNPAWVGEDIAFTNFSTNTAYSEWDLGDGNVSTNLNLIHYYIDPGTYTVTLNSYGDKKGMSRVSYMVEVTGSELKIIVKEYYDEYLIPDASVYLYASEDDWWDPENSVPVAEAWTNSYGECIIEGLSYQKYYVDVYYNDGNTEYHNYDLAADDFYTWIETQDVSGGWDHTFVAYVDVYDVSSQQKSTGQPAVRPSRRDVTSMHKGATTGRPLKENKISIKKERK